MTTEEKIDRIHDAVIKIQSDMDAGKIVCSTIHKAVDERVTGLHRSLNGNGQPGLKQKIESIEDKQNKLSTSFAVFRTKVVTWSAAGGFIGSGIMFLLANWNGIKASIKALMGGQ